MLVNKTCRFNMLKDGERDATSLATTRSWGSIGPHAGGGFSPRQFHLCPSTKEKYKGVVRDFVKPSWIAAMAVAAVRKDDVRRWRKEQLDVKYASSTVNSNFAVLQSLMRASGNADAVDLPMLSTKQDAKTNRKEPNKLNAEELDKFLAAARECCSPDRFASVLVVLTTTLRPGALLALRMDDLDLETKEVVATRRLSKGEVIPGVKGDRFGEDTPPLLPEVHDAILEARKKFNEEQSGLGSRKSRSNWPSWEQATSPKRRGSRRARRAQMRAQRGLGIRSGVREVLDELTMHRRYWL